MTEAQTEAATTSLTQTALDAQERVGDAGVFQLHARGQQHLRGAEEAQAQTRIQVGTITLAVADIAVGRLNGGAGGHVDLVDHVFQVVVEHAGAQHAGIVGQTVFQVRFIADGFFLRQLRVARQGVLIVVAAGHAGGEVAEAQLRHVLFHRCAELDGRRDIETVVDLGTHEVEVALVAHVTGLLDGGRLEQQRAFQRHPVVDLPVVHHEVLVAHLFHQGIGIGAGHQAAEGWRGDAGTLHAQLQLRIQNGLGALDAELQGVGVVQVEGVRGADDALLVHRLVGQVQELGGHATHDVIGIAGAFGLVLVDDEQGLEAAAAGEGVFVVAAYLPGLVGRRNAVVFRVHQVRGHCLVDNVALGGGGRIGLGQLHVEVDAVVQRQVVADVGRDHLGGLVAVFQALDDVIRAAVRQDAGLVAVAEFIARLGRGAEQVTQGAALAGPGDGAARVQRAVEVMVDVHFRRNAGTGFRFQKNDVDDLRAAAHVQIAGSAADDLDVLHLIGRNAGQLGIAFVFLAGDAAAVDQNLISASAQTATIGATGTAGAAIVAATAHCQVDARDAVQHVIHGIGFVLGEEVGGIAHRRFACCGSILRRSGTGCQQQGCGGKGQNRGAWSQGTKPRADGTKTHRKTPGLCLSIGAARMRRSIIVTVWVLAAGEYAQVSRRQKPAPQFIV